MGPSENLREALKKRVTEARILECALWRGGAKGRKSNNRNLSDDEKIFGSIESTQSRIIKLILSV